VVRALQRQRETTRSKRVDQCALHAGEEALLVGRFVGRCDEFIHTETVCNFSAVSRQQT